MKKRMVTMMMFCLMAALLPMGVRAEKKEAVVLETEDSITQEEQKTAASLTPGQVKDITFQMIQSGIFYKTTLEANTHYRIKSVGMLPFYVRLYDGDGKLVSFKEDNTYKDEDVTYLNITNQTRGFHLKESGTYYIKLFVQEEEYNPSSTIHFSYSIYTVPTFEDTLTRDINDKDNLYSFIPSVTGLYSFKGENQDGASIDLVTYRENYEDREMLVEETYILGRGYVISTVNLKANRKYVISVNLYNQDDFFNDTEGFTLSLVKSAAADQVIGMISSIGEVSVRSEGSITAAKAAYDKLMPAEKRLVTNAGTLSDAQKTYDKIITLNTKIQKIKKASKNSVALTWNKVKNAQGYQIICSYRKNNSKKIFKTQKITIQKPLIHNKTILLKGKKGAVSVKICAYIKVGGKKVYGGFTSEKIIR